MSVVRRSVVCDRVRAQISLRLDGELSQLESRMLASHLDRCPECSAYESEVVALTTALRSAPLAPLPHPIVVRWRRRASVVRMQVGVAAAVAIAVVGATTQIVASENEPAFGSPARFPTSKQLTQEVEQIMRDGRNFLRHGTAMPL